jgi:hypothetical protein
LAFSSDGADSPYSGLTYAGLDELKPTFDLRTIRNIVVKQVRPDDDKSSIFELFNRLNTGGVNLSQQEIRMSLFFGPFMRATAKMNEDDNWRVVLGGSPDQRQKDVEVLLRMFALATRYETFRKPLSKFINEFCKDVKKDAAGVEVYKAAFVHYATCMASIDRELYLEPRSKRISVPVLEAVFVASAQEAIRENSAEKVIGFTGEHLTALKAHADFDKYFTGKTTDVDAIRGRIGLAKKLILPR